MPAVHSGWASRWHSGVHESHYLLLDTACLPTHTPVYPDTVKVTSHEYWHACGVLHVQDHALQLLCAKTGLPLGGAPGHAVCGLQKLPQPLLGRPATTTVGLLVLSFKEGFSHTLELLCYLVCLPPVLQPLPLSMLLEGLYCLMAT